MQASPARGSVQARANSRLAVFRDSSDLRASSALLASLSILPGSIVPCRRNLGSILGVTRPDMKFRSPLAIVLALILTALPAFAGVCDLRCASVQGLMRPLRTDGTRVAETGGASGPAASASCPLHSAEKPGSAPTRPSPRPCHGQRNGGSNAVLTTFLIGSSIASGHSPVAELFAVENSLPGRANLVRSDASAFGRMPRSSPLPSILRL